MAVSGDQIYTGTLPSGSDASEFSAWQRRYGFSDDEAYALWAYRDLVAEPRYSFGDNITGKTAQKNQAYEQALKDYRYNDMQAASAREYNEMREDSVFQRMNDDLKKAGISPYGILSASGNQPISYVVPNSSKVDKPQSSDGLNVIKGLQTIITTALMAYLMFA